MNDFSKFIEILKERVVLSTIVQEKTKLQRHGKNYTGCCPFHQEKTPSFHVDDNKGKYHCFGCGADGDAINFIQEKNGFTFIEAVEYLADRFGLTLPKQDKKNTSITQDNSLLYQALEDITCWMHDNLFKSIGHEALLYLQKRGLSIDIIKLFRIGYAPKGYSYLQDFFSKKYSVDILEKVDVLLKSSKTGKMIDRFRHRVMFPITNQKGQVIAFGGRSLEDDNLPKYLNSSDTPLFSKSTILYNHYIAKKNTTNTEGYIVVEGYLDVISLYQQGIKTAVAPLGTSLTDQHLALLWKHQTPPVLCFDGDKAGYNAAVRAAYKALPQIEANKQLMFSILPDGEDPDSFIQSHKELFLSCIQKPKTLSLFLWDYLSSHFPYQTAEDLSALKEKINETIRLIQNKNSQESYNFFFQKQYNNLLYQSKKSFTSKKADVKKIQPPKRTSENIFILQKILLAILIEHPYLLPASVDQLILVDFEDDLKNIADFLIHYSGILEKDGLILEIKNCHLDVKQVIDQNIINQVPFILSKDKTKVLEGWKEIYTKLYQQVELNKEVSKANASFKKAFDQENWERIKKLKHLQLKDKQDHE